MSLYTDMVELGVPISNHYSDLYVPATPETRALIKKHGRTAESFINQVEGGVWLDVPFAFDPYWERRMGS